jgi:hypothetical protein
MRERERERERERDRESKNRAKIPSKRGFSDEIFIFFSQSPVIITFMLEILCEVYFLF